MTTKSKVIISVVALAGAYSAGRWASPTKVLTQTQTVQTDSKKEQTKSDLDLNKHKETTTTTIRKPDGTVETTTKVTEDTSANRTQDTKISDKSKDISSQTKEVTYATPKVTISALAGYHIGDLGPVYGASVTKPVFGPVTLGIFGFSDGLFGVSAGITF